MKKALKSIIKPKKVELKDVASPRPSRAALHVLNSALKRAYKDQKTLSKQAEFIRSN